MHLMQLREEIDAVPLLQFQNPIDEMLMRVLQFELDVMYRHRHPQFNH